MDQKKYLLFILVEKWEYVEEKEKTDVIKDQSK